MDLVYRRDVPFVTVVTDLGGAHPTWFNKKVDKVFVASEAVRGVAFDEGVSAAQVSGWLVDWVYNPRCTCFLFGK